jgi:hypothetical protein
MPDNYVEPVVIVTMRFDGLRKGLVVLTREPSAQQWEELAPLLDAVASPMRFVDIFCTLLDSWNLRREDGTAVPATKSGLMSMNLRFVTAVLSAWLNNGIVVNENATSEAAPAEQAEDIALAEDEEELIDPFEGMNIQPVDMSTYAPGLMEEVGA